MFGPSDDADSDDNDLLEEDAPENSEDFINCFEQLHELLEEAEDNETKNSSESSGEFVPLKDCLVIISYSIIKIFTLINNANQQLIIIYLFAC